MRYKKRHRKPLDHACPKRHPDGQLLRVGFGHLLRGGATDDIPVAAVTYQRLGLHESGKVGQVPSPRLPSPLHVPIGISNAINITLTLLLRSHAASRRFRVDNKSVAKELIPFITFKAARVIPNEASMKHTSAGLSAQINSQINSRLQPT